MKYEIILSGFGGQGVMSIGKNLVEAGMEEGLFVTWVPSYGPEMRGGTANCTVILSDEPIGAPLVDNPTEIVVMNRPSLAKFEPTVVPGGTVFINSSVVEDKVTREDLKAYYIPCDAIALELGNAKVSNMVMLGAVNDQAKLVEGEMLLEAFKKVFGASKEKFIPINKEALAKGAEAARNM